MSLAILNAHQRQTTFWKWQDYGYFVIIGSTIRSRRKLIPGLSD